MKREASDAGSYRVPATDEQIPRIQILMVRELLQGWKARVPTTQVSPTHQAPRIKRPGGHQLPLR